MFELRADRDWTQKHLAKIAGVSEPTVVHIEGGQVRPRLSTLRRIAKAFDMSVGELTTDPKAEGSSAVRRSLLDGPDSPGHNYLALGPDGNLRDAQAMSVPEILVRLQDLSEERAYLMGLAPVEMGMPNPRARRTEIKALRSLYVLTVMELLSLAAKKSRAAAMTEEELDAADAEIGRVAAAVLQEADASVR